MPAITAKKYEGKSRQLTVDCVRMARQQKKRVFVTDWKKVPYAQLVCSPSTRKMPKGSNIWICEAHGRLKSEEILKEVDLPSFFYIIRPLNETESVYYKKFKKQ